MNRRADARRTHGRIVQAATDLIAARQALTMTALAREAEVSRPTLYSHFGRVEDVIESAVERALLLVEETGGDVTSSDAPAPERLHRLLRTRWQRLAEHAEAYRLATTELPPGRMEELHERTVGPLTELIDQGKQVGDFRTDLPTGWLVAVVHGVLHQAAEEVLDGRLYEEDAAELVTRTVLSVLAN